MATLTAALRAVSSKLIADLAELDTFTASLDDKTRGLCACSVAGCFEEDFGQHDRPQGDALPRGTDARWTMDSVLYKKTARVGAAEWGEETTFDAVLGRLPFVKGTGMLAAVTGGEGVLSERSSGEFPFLLFRTTLRDVLCRGASDVIVAAGESILTHESMYPLAAWHQNYGFLDALIRRDFSAYEAWHDSCSGAKDDSPDEGASLPVQRACASRISEAGFDALADAFEEHLDLPIVLHVGAKPNASLRPTTTDGPGTSPWGFPNADFWRSKGDPKSACGKEEAGPGRSADAVAEEADGDGASGPYGWRVITTGDNKTAFGAMDSGLFKSLVRGSHLIASAGKGNVGASYQAWQTSSSKAFAPPTRRSVPY